MGYTHYWYSGDAASWSAAFPQIQLDAVKIVQEAERLGIALADGLSRPGSKPVITEGVIDLNGSADLDQDYETFRLTSELLSFDCTKTGRQPYDVVVCAILLRAVHHAPDGIRVSSDGDWDLEWFGGPEYWSLSRPAELGPRELVRRLFGDDPACPFKTEASAR